MPIRLPTSSLLWSLFATAAIALRCVGPCDHYDTGFYGAMTVRWFNTYPLVPGLANLMAQLSYNSSVFLCVAALNHGPWNGLAFHLFPGLLLTALVFAVVPVFCRVWRGESRATAELFLTLLVIPVLFWVTNSEIIGINTDLSTTFVALPAISYLLSQETHEDPCSSDLWPLGCGAVFRVLSGACFIAQRSNSELCPCFPRFPRFPRFPWLRTESTRISPYWSPIS